MENRINIAELLKDCPTGMELDCLLYDGVIFEEIEDDIEYPIVIRTKEGETLNLTSTGCWDNNPSAKCVIFPKGKTTWEGFVSPRDFKDGDVVFFVTSDGDYRLCIIDCIVQYTLYTKVLSSVEGTFLCPCLEHFNIKDLVVLRLATKEEKQKLFDAIKDNWYKWNPETKTLEKLVEPEFKVGDRIRHKNDKTVITITGIKDDYYFIQFYNIRKNDYQNEKISFKDQDKYELVSNKFDIYTLIPFESKVLVRDDGYSIWQPCVWGLYDKGHRFPYVTTGCRYRQCIPYRGNEYLLGKTESCHDFYKTWE